MSNRRPSRSDGPSSEQATGSTTKAKGGKRFAAYMRVSTEQLQSPQESRLWQLGRINELIAGHGTITCEFFDQGQSRSIPWRRRPQASALLSEAATKNRRFDAVVIAEPARAFAGTEVSNVFPVLTHHGVELWCPEFGPNPIDPTSEAADMLLTMFGSMSKAERNRLRVRVRSAMMAQAAEGRFLGGSPPYGYVLVDSDTPHPNANKAREGRMLRVLAVDPVTAPVVRRIYESYLGGKGMRRICDDLNAEGIENPSSRQQERYAHRKHNMGCWSPSALGHILRNVSYTGRQVYGRSRRQEVLVDATDPGLGTEVRHRITSPDQWVFAAVTHEPLISAEMFQATQERLRSRRTGKGPQELATGRQPYALRGLIVCGACGNRLAACTVKGRRYYRCYLASTDYSRVGPAGAALDEAHPRSSYLREDHILPRLNEALMELFDPSHIEETAKVLAEGGPWRSASVDDDAYDAQADRWQRTLAEAEANLVKYRALVDVGDAPLEVVGRWIAEAEEQRRTAEHELDRLEPDRPPTVEEVKELLVKFRRVANRLKKADPQVLSDAYRALGLRITYEPKSPTARWELAPGVARPDDPLYRTVQAVWRGSIDVRPAA